MRKSWLIPIISVGFLSSCSHIKPTTGVKSVHTKQTPTQIINNYKNESQKSDLDKAIVVEDIKKSPFLKEVRTAKVEKWIKYYSTRYKQGFERQLARAEKYRPLVERTFEQYGLPKELFYVGIIESGFNLSARSHAAAVGPWQFVKGTARRYGLKITRSIDERKNIYKSTEAAALYFQDLYNIFGSWELALSAYNAGEYGIIRRLRKSNTREYYELSRRKIIPRETRNYVPKVLAVKHVIENHRKYNINIVRPKYDLYTHAKSIKIHNSTSINKLAKQLNVSSRVLKNLNHDINGTYIPYMGRKGYEIFVPRNTKIADKLARSLAHKAPRSKVVTRTSPRSRKKITRTNRNAKTHRVRRSESLYSISKRYGTSIKNLMAINNLKKRTIYVGQKLKLPSSSLRSKVVYSYTVKSGDNLSTIASHFNTKIKNIKRLNRLARTQIFTGQVLKVPPHHLTKYVVKNGDILGSIARKNNKSITWIRKVNGIKGHIYPGQKLIVNIKPI